MGKVKPNVTKKSKRGVDFKKIKRKVGRKLPPPKNFTDTSIKSKAIILPEQSVATDKSGLAVSKKGLTLRELLQQTSHHNAKTRKAALAGLRDLVLQHPSELKLHKLSIIEKLRERICDHDKGVREAFCQILKTVIFPAFKEDTMGPLISLLMAYVFNAMTHIAVDIRLMAFKFFEVIVLFYPSSFILYADQVLDNYADILRNYQIYLQDKSNLKNALGGLVHCLSLLVSKSGEDDLNEPNIDEKRRLYSYTSEAHYDDAVIFSVLKKFEGLVPALVNSFEESSLLIQSTSAIDAQSFDCLLCTLSCINLSVKFFVEKMNKVQARPLHFVSLPDGRPDVNCNMLDLLKKLWKAFPIGQMHHSNGQDADRYFVLNVKISEIFLRLFQWINDSSFPLEKFLRFIESFLLGEIDSGVPSNKALLDKNLCLIVPFIPQLISQAVCSWRTPLLKAFTFAFMDCKVDSQICLLYIDAIKEMLVPTTTCCMLLSSHPEMSKFQADWLHELPRILCCIGDRHADISNAILKLLLSIGKYSTPNSYLAQYNNLQQHLTEFYSKSCNNAVTYGPFINLPIGCQELAICGIYYFSRLTTDMLESLTSCCLNPALDICIVIRITEVLFSGYKAGHVCISDLIGFFLTLIARFKVYPNRFSIELKDGNNSNRETFKSLTGYVCSCLTQMGDNSLVLKLLNKSIFNEILQKLSLDNAHGLLKMIITLDAKPSKLLDESIGTLSEWLAQYMIDAAWYLPEGFKGDVQATQFRIFRYYVWPCVILLYRSGMLLFHVLQLFAFALLGAKRTVQSHSDGSYPLELSAKVHAVSSILIIMHNDKRFHKSLSASKSVIEQIVQNIGNLRDSTIFSLTLDDKHKLQMFYDILHTRFKFATLE